MNILGIETSCDETSAAVVAVTKKSWKIKSNIVASQIKIHRAYGGVVPEVAARNHIRKLIPVIDTALHTAQCTWKNIDRIAVTTGPGLISSLNIGVEAAKTLALTTKKPIVAVNHVQAHAYAAWLTNTPIRFPALALIVSGGHTELVHITSTKKFKKIGQTLDDAAGESFDKVAKMLDLGYPGGPVVSKRAEQGNRCAFKFPRPMLTDDTLAFSFAGLKTSVLYTIQKLKKPISEKTVNDLCASFQQAVVDVLVGKTLRAVVAQKPKTVILAGGVAANKALRMALERALVNTPCAYVVPPFALCTDNAAMIAAAGYFGTPINPLRISANPNYEIS